MFYAYFHLFLKEVEFCIQYKDIQPIKHGHSVDPVYEYAILWNLSLTREYTTDQYHFFLIN